MNSKLVKLLHEGFSMTTLENLNERQLNVLYKKITEDKGSVRMPADKADPAKLKSLTDQGINVEVSEDLEDPMDFEMGKRTQNAKQVGPSTDDGQDDYGDGMPAESNLQEKAVSKQQQKIMGLALSVKRGDTPKSKVSKSVQKMAKEMSKKELEDFASTKHKGLPSKVEANESDEKFIQKATKEIEKKGTKGSFKEYCGGEVTMNCIKKGLKSDDPKIVKKANFAKNIGGYKGAEHNEVKNLEESILRIIENHLPPHTTKGELLNYIRRNA